MDKTKGIGALPEQRSRITLSRKLIVTKLGKRMDSREKRNHSSF